MWLKICYKVAIPKTLVPQLFLEKAMQTKIGAKFKIALSKREEPK